MYAIALTAQVMIEPARRRYDAETRAKLVELFGPPERWATTTRSLVWHQADALVPAFTGSTTFRMAVPATFDMEVASSKFLYGLPDGEVPLAFNFNGTVHYRGDDGRLQMSLIPWSCSAEFRLPVATWRDLIEHYYPSTGWIALREETLLALQREKAERALPTLDACVAELLGSAVSVAELGRLAALRGLRAVPVHAGSDQERDPDSVRHRLSARVRPHARLDPRPPRAPVHGRGRRRDHGRGALPPAERRAPPGGAPHESPARASSSCGEVAVRTTLTASAPGAGRREVSFRVDNSRTVPGRARRAGRRSRHSLISTHPILRVTGGARFVSQLDAPCDSVNTWPVLASPEDDVMIGAAIVLPDHPRIAPESRGNLFDNTEIEEALVLHVHALSDGERAEIEEQDDAVREMIDRALAVTPDEVLEPARAHGAARPGDGRARARRMASATASRASPRGRRRPCATPRGGCPRWRWTASSFRRGGRVVVRPGVEADLQARMLEGRTVTVERIHRDYDGRVHLGVSVDEPGHEVLRETGRFLWFFPPEVEVVE